MRTRVPAIAAVLLAIACRGSQQTDQLREAVRAARAPLGVGSVALRFAGQDGQDVRLYRLPTLQDLQWQFTTPGLVASRGLGFSPEDDRAWILTPEGTLVGLEMETGRARIMDSLVTQATLSPRGAPLVAHGAGPITSIRGRRGRSHADSVPGTIERVAGTVDDRVLVVTRTAAGRQLFTLGAAGDRTPEPRPLPEGPLAIAPWGDALAIATDSGLWVLERGRPEHESFQRAETGHAVRFTASGHRLLLATGTAVRVLDRFELVPVDVKLFPSDILALRTDPWGRVLLARHSTGDSLWVVPLVGPGTPVPVPGSWDGELPAVSPDGVILARVGDDVVAYAPDGVPQGRVRGGADDRWVLAAWDPRRPELQLANVPAAPLAAQDPVTNQNLYVQVASTSNSSWAEDLARDLRQAGISASVLLPDPSGEMYRVVVGPFGTRDEAETTGRSLGMPFWIFSPVTPADGQ